MQNPGEFVREQVSTVREHVDRVAGGRWPTPPAALPGGRLHPRAAQRGQGLAPASWPAPPASATRTSRRWSAGCASRRPRSSRRSPAACPSRPRRSTSRPGSSTAGPAVPTPWPRSGRRRRAVRAAQGRPPRALRDLRARVRRTHGPRPRPPRRSQHDHHPEREALRRVRRGPGPLARRAGQDPAPRRRRRR